MERSNLFAWLTTHGVRIVGILAFAFIATRLVRLAVRRMETRLEASPELTTEQSLHRRATVGNVLTSAARVAVWSIAVLMLLGELGVNLAPVVAGAGIAGVALGFGAQHLVRDVLAGFFMLVENQFQVGNLIEIQTEVAAITGRIERLSLRATWIRAFDGTLHVVPNGAVLFIGNRSRGWARAIVDVPIAPDADPEATRRELESVLKEIEHRKPRGVLSGPRVLGIERLNDWNTTIRVVAETKPSARFDVERELRMAIARRLDDLRESGSNGSKTKTNP